MIGLLAHLFIMALSPKCLIAPIISIYSNINLDSFDIIPGAKKPVHLIFVKSFYYNFNKRFKILSFF